MDPSRVSPDRILIISLGRSASNLLGMMLSNQTNHDYSAYYFQTLMLTGLTHIDEGPSSCIPAEELESRHQTRQANFEKMLAKVEESDKAGRKTLIKEHSDALVDFMDFYRNAYPGDEGKDFKATTPGATQPEAYTPPLAVPDSFLLKFQPIMTMRHPALMYPSMVRAWLRKKSAGFHEVFQLATMRSTRLLYDFYEKHDITPIVVDGNDIIGDPECVPTLCRLTGMDPDAIVHEWDMVRKEDDPEGKRAAFAAFRSTIDASTGVIRAKATSAPNMDQEKPKWTAEFGEKWADELEKRIKKAMPHYEWLYERRMRTSA